MKDGEKFKQWIKIKGYTLDEVAELIDVSGKSVVHAMCNSEKFQLRTEKKLYEKLGFKLVDSIAISGKAFSEPLADYVKSDSEKNVLEMLSLSALELGYYLSNMNNKMLEMQKEIDELKRRLDAGNVQG